MDSRTITEILVMAFLILMSAYFSATETAFSSLNRTRLKTMAEKGSKRAVLACRLSESYDKLLSTILIGNNIVNIATASIGTVLFVRLYGDIGATLSTVVITIVVLIFGEITPKSIAKDCPEKFAMFSAPLLRLLMWLLTPVNFLFSQWKRLIAKLLRLEADTKMSQEELLMLVEEVEEGGSIDRDEGELLRSAIEFTEREADDILTHRTEMEAVSADTPAAEVARRFAETKFSRIPVYEDTIDNIIDYTLSPYSNFIDSLKGCSYSTDVPGSTKNVSSLNPLSVALVADDEELYRRRAYPIVEYMLSRKNTLFCLDTTQKVQSPSRELAGPCAPISELAGLYRLSGGKSPMLRHFADDGIVSLGRGTVTVADAEKLRRLAGM